MPAKILVLLRHGKSDWGDPAQADHDRPLAKRGRKAARAIGRHMRETKLRPGLVLCSSAVRARQTCEEIEPALPADVRLMVEGGLYGASSEELLDRLRHVAARVPMVMVIAHNPGLQDFAVQLAGSPADRDLLAAGFPTGALARFSIPSWKGIGEGSGELLELVLPRLLRDRH